MGELGADAEARHRELGATAQAAGVERLWAFGPSAAATCEGFGAGARRVEDLEALAEHLCLELTGDVALLVKGSRSNRLEALVERLLPTATGGG
jgi:UDP-N-acetylmuramoyl-tripeptide--D-alanyl-D-alanine ligase